MATTSAPASSARWASSGPDSSSASRRATLVDTMSTAVRTGPHDTGPRPEGGSTGRSASRPRRAKSPQTAGPEPRRAAAEGLPPQDTVVAQLDDEGGGPVGDRPAGARVDAAEGD